MKYVWAAYKKGNLASMGARWGQDGMDPNTFEAEFFGEVSANYHGAWTLFAETSRGFIPVGIVLAFYSHPNPQMAPFMIVGDLIWMPWASERNKVESAVNFFNDARKEMAFVEYAEEKYKAFFEMIARHGVMRRVGTTYNVISGAPVAIFETRGV